MRRILLLLSVFLVIFIFVNINPPRSSVIPIAPTPFSSPKPTAEVTTPTPRPLTFQELNSLYGPCAKIPVLMYHHINLPGQAPSSLEVTPDTFRTHLQYLKSHNYSVITMQVLADYFDSGKTLPAKSALLTFDDGYQDFADYAVPLLREFNFPAALFLPTGLADNPGYLKWSEIQDISGRGDIQFANHTWSHQQMKTTDAVISREITTADTQLTDHGLNHPKVFSYPYGTISSDSSKVLSNLGYSLAFTTRSGSVLCAKQRLSLPRIRIGNSPLSNYGL